MARVTVEDCAEVINSRFELVAVAAQRAKTIAAGGKITVERDNDKNAVIALREIAGQTVNIDQLRENLIQNCQEKVNVDQYGVEEMEEGNIDNEIIEDVGAATAEAGAIEDAETVNMSDEELLYGGDDVTEEVED